MLKPLLIALSLTCALAMSGCKTAGGAVSPPPVCPVLPEAPLDLMQAPETEKKVWAELFSPPANVMPK